MKLVNNTAGKCAICSNVKCKKMILCETFVLVMLNL